MTRPLLLDLFCGAGGAAVGYHRAGFDVVGVDIKPQPHYPFPFIQADALEYLEFLARAGTLASLDAIHASPPCQRYSMSTAAQYRDSHPDLLGPVRESLQRTGLPWVIENVPGAPMRADLMLCGCMFGLPNLKRERWFETSWNAFDMRQPCDHREPVISVTGTGPGTAHQRFGHIRMADERRAMGIDWMNRRELVQAIPPAYTEYIGKQLIDALERAA